MSVKTDTENKKGMLVFGQLPQTSAKEAAELEASCLKEAWSKKAWEDALEDKNAWYAGAWLDGRLVGCCGLWQSFEDADICNVAVDQTLRRQGIGEQRVVGMAGREVMKNIRKKMGVTPGEKRYIINELGVGYRMLAEDEIAADSFL